MKWSDDAIAALLKKSKVSQIRDHCELIISTIRCDDNSVVNLSSINLSEAQRSILSRGLTFVPTPGEPDMGDLRSDLDRFHRRLKLYTHFNKDPTEAKPIRVRSQTSIPAPTDTQQMGTGDQGSSDLEPVCLRTEDGRRILDHRKLRNLGPFSHPTFTNPSTYEPPNTPRALETLIDTNEFELSKFKFIKPTYQNITKTEREGLKQLMNNPSIVIKQADKGSAVVLMDRCDYVAEGMSQLGNEKFYKPLMECPTASHDKEICDFLSKMKLRGEISEKTFNYLAPMQSRTPEFYLLPKIHKPKRPPPGRPIISANSCPTERISQFVDHFVKPLLPKIKSYLRDSTDFINSLLALGKVKPGSRLVTWDVTSLYTNISHKLGMAAIKLILEANRESFEMPSNESLLHLLELVLKRNNFQFDGKDYLQVGGTAMGTRVAPSLANFFMAVFEEEHILPKSDKILFYRRFLDDIIAVWGGTETELDEFTEMMNSCHDDIKFTCEHSPSEIPFLDTLIHLDDDGTIWTSLYSKPTDSHNYLHYDSAHPTHMKKSIPYSQMLRIRRICTLDSDFIHECMKMMGHFLRRGYPLSLLENAFIKVQDLERMDTLKLKEKEYVVEGQEDLYLISTFNPGNTPFRTIIQNNWPILSRSSATKELSEKRIIFGYRKEKNLKDMLVRAKLPLSQPTNSPETKNKNLCKTAKCNHCPLLNKDGEIHSSYTNVRYSCKKNISCKSSNLIYCIQCRTCKKQYVGQTSTTIMKRLQGHVDRVKRKVLSDDIGRHFNLPGHNGKSDIELFVLDFVYTHPGSSYAQSLRLLIEHNWIHRLRTMLPMGLNTMQNVKFMGNSRSWKHYKTGRRRILPEV